jgi:hypothetical protein
MTLLFPAAAFVLIVAYFVFDSKAQARAKADAKAFMEAAKEKNER